MVVSCTLAVLVNVSQFMCLGRFSAVSFQVRFPPPLCGLPAWPRSRLRAEMLGGVQALRLRAWRAGPAV